MSWTEGFLLGHFVLNMMLALRVIYSRRESSAAMGWLVVLFAFPYLGMVVYVLIGEPRLGNARARRKAELLAFYASFRGRVALPEMTFTEAPPRFAQIAHLSAKEAGFVAHGGNRVTLLTETEAMLNAFVRDIDNAKVSCLLMFYIVEGTGRVAAVLEALMAAAQRGVSCQLLVDDVGSRPFVNSHWPERLRAAGVRVTNALPVGMFKTLLVRSDLRNHRKLLVVDYQVAYTGSYNLVDPAMFKRESGVGEWVDAVMRVEGPAVRVLSAVFYADWAVENDDNLKATMERIDGYFADEQLPEVEARGQAVLQVIPSAPDGESAVVYDTLMCALYAAQQRVVITTPYFVPDEALLGALLNAARRGVEVVLMLPARNDSRLVGYASRAYYQLLLNAGVRLEMFGGGLLHTKTVVVDEAYALFGTVNMDMRSFYLNMELSLAVFDATTVAQVVALQEAYLAQCQRLSSTRWQKRPRLQRFLERCVRLMSPLL